MPLGKAWITFFSQEERQAGRVDSVALDGNRFKKLNSESVESRDIPRLEDA